MWMGSSIMAETPISTFISYSRVDSAFVDRLEADLRAYGFDTWVDRQHLEGGDDWARVIEKQIEQRETQVVALSPDAITSTWVRREIIFALNGGKHIIPIIVRPVERIPIEIVNLEYIDLSADYASGLQDVSVALLKTRSLQPPPRPAQAPQPLLHLPDVSDPLKGLVEIPAPPPAPNPDRNALFMQALTAQASDNLDLAEALLGQLVEQEADFGHGLADEELQRVRKQLVPVRIQRLRTLADEAHATGAWGQEIGALRALSARVPDDGTIAGRLKLAENCQKWAWLYEDAHALALSGDKAATRLALLRLWDKAPEYGDPSGIAPDGMQPPKLASVRQSPPNPLPLRNQVQLPARDTQFPTLVAQAGDKLGRVVVINKVPFTIGRDKGNDLVIEDQALSRLHATINSGNRELYGVRDEGTSNGTYVNGQRISVQWLKDGDEIEVGQTVLLFRTPEPESRPIFRIFSN